MYVCPYIYLLYFLMNHLFSCCFEITITPGDWWATCGHSHPQCGQLASGAVAVSSFVRWTGGVELYTERHRSQKIYRSSEENRSKWVLFGIPIYRSSGYNPIFCPAVSAELPGVLMFWNPVQGHKVPCRVAHGCKHWAPLWFTENIRHLMWILSIGISIIDLNVHRWSTTKLI